MTELIIKPEFQDLIAPLTTAEYKILEESILKEGCREAIITWNGIILDGHHRYKICREHGISFVSTEVKNQGVTNETTAKIWMVLNQVGRRNLDKTQKAVIYGEKLEALEAVAAAERRKARQFTHEHQPGKEEDTDKEVLPEPLNDNEDLHNPRGQARDKAAKNLGISGRLISEVKLVRQEAPELLPKMAAGELYAEQAVHIAKTKDPEKKANKIKSVLSVEGKEEVQKRAKEIREAEKKEREDFKLQHQNNLLEQAAAAKGFTKQEEDPKETIRKVAAKAEADKATEEYKEKDIILKQEIGATLDTWIVKGYDIYWITKAFAEVLRAREKYPQGKHAPEAFGHH